MLPKLENFVCVNFVWIDKFVDKFEYNFFSFYSQNRVCHRLENIHDFEIVTSSPLTTFLRHF